jgi:DNA-binding transcriptional ArsR family regulator
VSKHLKVLAESGIVSAEPRGRQRIYQLQAEPFHQIVHWVDSFDHLWDVRLGSLGDYLQSSETKEDES